MLIKLRIWSCLVNRVQDKIVAYRLVMNHSNGGKVKVTTFSWSIQRWKQY